jgi:DNA-binding XRE family transcriptional regulator
MHSAHFQTPNSAPKCDECDPLEPKMQITDAELFGKVIRARRKALGVTQQDLANALGVSRRLISEMENATRSTSLDTALAAAADLGLDMSFLPRPI